MLVDRNNTWHVHTKGDTCLSDGTSVGGHFVGDCVSCRPDGALQEVGLLNNGTAIHVSIFGGVYLCVPERGSS